MTTSDPLVEFVEVEKTYDGEINVVETLNLTIQRGEFLTLLGPSGSGKTTTLMMLAGFEDPTAGDIVLNGRSLRRVPPFERNIGVVFQNYALFPHMTVAENVAFPLVQRKLTKSLIQEKTASALEMVELGALARRHPRQLSGGQQQRVALARALVFEPELVLMDEPLGALDKKLREQMQLEIKHLHAKLGMTVVYVTHDQSEALTMSDRVAIFHDGIIQQIDTPKAVYEAPENTFVADFVGENNALLGIIEHCTETSCQVRLDGGEQISAPWVKTLGDGDRTSVSVRPERIRLDARADDCDNVLRTRIEEVIYLGDQIRVHMMLADGTRMMAKRPMADDTEQLQPGAMIAIGWDTNYCRALALQ